MNFLKRAFNGPSFALVLLCTGAYSPAIGQGEPEFTLNLNNTDVYALIETVSNATGRNFVVDPRVSGKVTVISTTPVTAEKLYEMFLSVLQVHGFSAVPAGSLTKIVPDFAAKQGPVPVLGVETEERDQLVSQVIPINNVPAAPLVQILRPMVPQEGQLAANPASNSLLVTDRAANIQRLMEIIKLIDVPDSDEVDLVHLHQASAADIVRTLSPLQRAGGAGPNGTASMQLLADERTNSILISGNQAVRTRVRGLIEELDSPVESGGNTRVIFLNYAEAEDIAAIISGDGVLGTLEPTSGGVAQAPAPVPPPAAVNDGSGAVATTQQNNRPVAGAPIISQQPGASRVDIKTDSNTNSLIITAPPAEMATLLAIIERLDIRRPQVLVEAVIAEVSEDNIRELGINFLVDGFESGGPIGLSNLDGATGRLIGNVAANAAGLPPGIDNGTTFALGNFASGNIDFGLLFNAIASDADNNILSTPTIVTLDNEEAEIVVGTNVPFITGQQLSTNNDNPFQTIERQDVGLRLKVKPQINEGDTIKLELEQEVSSVNATSLAGAADITTSTRSINTTVLVEDGQTLVLGGLNDDMVADVVEKVPLLGDIPVVGRLFQYKSKTKSKTNLMIFLHPVILRDAETADRVSSSKYDELRDRRMLAEKFKQRKPDGGDDKKIPEIKLFHGKSNSQYQPVSNNSVANNLLDDNLFIDNSLVVPGLEVVNEVVSKEPEWVEMPDGSLLLK